VKAERTVPFRFHRTRAGGVLCSLLIVAACAWPQGTRPAAGPQLTGGGAVPPPLHQPSSLLVAANANDLRVEDPRRDELRVDTQAKHLQEENEKLRQVTNDLRHDRDLAHARAEDLQRRLDTAQEELASNKKALSDIQARLAALEKDKEQLTAALGEARDQARDLGTKLAAEQVKGAALREDKQKLMAGTTTAKEEIARLQKRAGELETEAARASDLAKRLAERDQEISKLRKAATEREALAGRMASLTDRLERTKQRVSTLTGELALLGEEAARMRQERDRLSLEIQKHQDGVRPEAPPPTMAPESESAMLEKPRPEDSTASLRGGGEEHPAIAATLSELSKMLQADIARGDITLQKGRDRLTITLVERVLFDSGQAQLKPTGLDLLRQLSGVLKSHSDKQIRVEGHTDNVPIGAKLKERFPTNWELSTARATSVVRFLVEDGGLDPANLSAVGYADTRPIGSNDVEEGRMANRRIDIVLHPKDRSEPTR
jgi:chemotaxis protein MotB